MKSDKKISAAKKVAKGKKALSAKAPSTTKKAPEVKSAAKAGKKQSTALRKKPSKTAKAVEPVAKAPRKAVAKVKAVTRKAEPPATTARKIRTPARKKKLVIPSILLEGDKPIAPQASGPGQKFSLGPTPPAEHFEEAQDLPESYGTKRLLIAARDPQWIYAHWDFTTEQLREYNSKSADGHLVVRVFKDAIGGKPVAEVHVHRESRNWFIHVGQGGTKYQAELGYNDKAGKWNRISVSGATLTPPDQMSEDTSVRFATIPVDVPFEELLRIVKAAVTENVPLAEAIEQLRAAGFKKIPAVGQWASTSWTPAQERALASIITMDTVRRLWIGSLEITELVRRQLVQGVSSMGAAQFSLPSSISLASLSSPFGGVERRKGFWFNVNAELIIYGATEPDAAVTIGDRQIKLRPDGTFSYRFILPDGDYHLPAQATSVDGDDTRSAGLKFTRKTDYRGDVGEHPQDPNMRAPRVENIS
ncbi:MAG: DUF4912 domain-containing protein [Verrucomicrobia bacterium]|nr:DUF4912 domain-containing protein [Verrucomicrobiota bacterium]